MGDSDPDVMSDGKALAGASGRKMLCREEFERVKRSAPSLQLKYPRSRKKKGRAGNDNVEPIV